MMSFDIFDGEHPEAARARRPTPVRQGGVGRKRTRVRPSWRGSSGPDVLVIRFEGLMSGWRAGNVGDALRRSSCQISFGSVDVINHPLSEIRRGTPTGSSTPRRRTPASLSAQTFTHPVSIS